MITCDVFAETSRSSVTFSKRHRACDVMDDPTKPHQIRRGQSYVALSLSEISPVQFYCLYGLSPILSLFMFFFLDNSKRLHGPSPTFWPFYFLGLGLFTKHFFLVSACLFWAGPTS